MIADMPDRWAAKCFALLVIVVSFGCAKPSPEEFTNADFGPYPNDYKSIIEQYLSGTLKDPYSARYEYVNSPRTAWSGLGGTRFGWVVCVRVNAKNSYGAYVGSKTHYFMIKEREVIRHFGGGGESSESFAAGACRSVN